MEERYIPSTWRRLIARGIDQGIRGICYLPFVGIFFDLVFTEEEVVVSFSTLLVLGLIPFMYEFVFLIIMQATPGKWLMGLKVVPIYGEWRNLSWQQCFIRSLMERLNLFFSWGLFAFAFYKYDRTHLIDWVADTRVVQMVPRRNRTKLRWVLASIFVIFYSIEGISTATHFMNCIDWETQQLDLRAAVDFDEEFD